MSKKVLIIDDDFDLVEAMRITLEAAGFEVVDAQDGESGLAMIKSEAPNLVILDVMMSAMDEGFHVAYKIREDESIKDTPIVMLTAVGNQTGFQFDPGKDADFLPVDTFLDKPVNPKKLVDVVRENIKV
ncbi:MAG: response regulator [Candidatus Marinimicrobia bacterium]|nr:response regulator [Candidatus Neomarinimicrobiota bacterium]MCF7850567.1 response regulator [Candidatus Neomarinimicrobiota bacterium]MCF7903699.1 response regulator [Candidatus Neomarinimicrobiota bacterium]